MRDLKDVSFDDVIDDPKRFGMPSFDEFCKNPDKYRKRDDDLLASADDGAQTFRKLVRKNIYFVDGYRCNTIEEAERVMKGEAGACDKYEMRPQIIPLSGGQCDVAVIYERKKDAILG